MKKTILPTTLAIISSLYSPALSQEPATQSTNQQAEQTPPTYKTIESLLENLNNPDYYYDDVSYYKKEYGKINFRYTNSTIYVEITKQRAKGKYSKKTTHTLKIKDKKPWGSIDSLSTIYSPGPERKPRVSHNFSQKHRQKEFQKMLPALDIIYAKAINAIYSRDKIVSQDFSLENFFEQYIVKADQVKKN